jgi:hypothetical protein
MMQDPAQRQKMLATLLKNRRVLFICALVVTVCFFANTIIVDIILHRAIPGSSMGAFIAIMSWIAFNRTNSDIQMLTAVEVLQGNAATGEQK